ncbi:hypothetical protein Dsin_019257 [Dipteronia sinensis]|uniref:THUMP domain-containing protein n=1 Tax=Dipteronia sinensis TaxID=43782 RepID=A0AAE0E2V9_9ROSI|nr:hypothetical protein Dsin_019257 [Dipteronia sinensis]
MAAEDKPTTAFNKGKKKRNHFRRNNVTLSLFLSISVMCIHIILGNSFLQKPMKKKGGYPIRPGVQGFFLTCDGGRERQASHEAISVIDSFFEELVHGKGTGMNLAGMPNKPLNKKIIFASSSSDDDDDEDDDDKDEDQETEKERKGEGRESDTGKDDDANKKKLINEKSDRKEPDSVSDTKEVEGMTGENKEDAKNHESQVKEVEEPPAKKQCLEADSSKSVINGKLEEKSIDKLIEAELKELGDKNKRRFLNLDAGCNGVGFVQMRKRDGDPGPKDIVQHMMTSSASTKKPISRFILRVLPIEVSCYASEEEISRAIKPLVAQYFPVETQTPQKFAVLYEARANTGIDRMKIINSVAKSVPAPHKVDLSNPDKTIVVEIVKTVCMIGVVERYKELAKYNLRQLTSPK